MRPFTVVFLALSLAVFAFWSAPASAQASPDEAQAPSSTWGVHEIVERVQRMDPRVRVSAAERLSAHIAKRRAQWNRIEGAVRLHAGHQVTSSGWMATEDMNEQTNDQAFAGAVAEVRLPLYAGGRICAALDAADAKLRAARHDEAALRLELATAALVAYAQALAAQEQTRVSERALSRARDLLHMTQRKHSAGIDTEADVARAELNLVRYREDVAMQRGARLSALTALRSVLLLDPSSPLQLRGSLAALVPAAETGPISHPEIDRARADLAQARAAHRVAKAGYLPSVELFAMGQYGNTLPGAPDTPGHAGRFGPLSGSAAAGARAGWTVFDFFVTRDQVAAAEARVAARRAQHDVTLVALRNRRNEAIRREQAAASRLSVLDEGRRVAARALSLARAQYETGNATLTEVLDAELEAIRLETHRVQAGLQRALASIDRMYAEGTRP